MDDPTGVGEQVVAGLVAGLPNGRQGQARERLPRVLEGPSVGHFREQVAGLEPSGRQGQARERLPSGRQVLEGPSVGHFREQDGAEWETGTETAEWETGA